MACPGLAISMLLPSFDISDCILADVPWPKVTSAITAPTPITMPSKVERSAARCGGWYEVPA